MTSLVVGVLPVYSVFLPTVLIMQAALLGFFVASYLILHRKTKHS